MNGAEKTREQLLAEYVLQATALANFNKASRAYRAYCSENIFMLLSDEYESLGTSTDSRELSRRLGQARRVHASVFRNFPEHTEEEDKRRREYQDELEAEGVDVFAYFQRQVDECYASI